MDSPERASSALLAFEGDARGASREACASLEDRTRAREPPLDGEVANEALSTEEAGGPSPQARQPSLALSGARGTRPPEKIILGSYVKPLEWSHPSANTPTPDQEAALLLVIKCNPFTTSASQWWLVLRSTPSPSLTTWIRGLISL